MPVADGGGSAPAPTRLKTRPKAGPPVPVQVREPSYADIPPAAPIYGPPVQQPRSTGVQRRNGDPNMEIVERPLLPEISGRTGGGIEAELLDRAKPQRGSTELADARAALREVQQDETLLPNSLDEWFGDRAEGFGRLGYRSRADRAQSAWDELGVAQRHERERAIGKPDLNTPVRKQVDRMTQEEWDALDPKQRAAVEFNAGLVGAVRTDRHQNNTYTPSKEERKKYDEDVKKMFGEEGASDKYAPETVGFLASIGYKDTSGVADLDDFLGLNAAIRTEDLDDLTTQAVPSAVMGKPVSPMSDKKMTRLDLSTDLVGQFRDFKERVNKDRVKLDTLGATLAFDRAEHVDMLGGRAFDEKDVNRFAKQGYLENTDEYFTTMTGYLDDDTGVYDPTKLWPAIKTDLSAKQYKQFVEFYEKHRKRKPGEKSENLSGSASAGVGQEKGGRSGGQATW